MEGHSNRSIFFKRLDCDVDNQLLGIEVIWSRARKVLQGTSTGAFLELVEETLLALEGLVMTGM